MLETISVPRLACITAAGKVLSIEKTFVLQLKSELCLKIVELIALVLLLSREIQDRCVISLSRRKEKFQDGNHVSHTGVLAALASSISSTSPLFTSVLRLSMPLLVGPTPPWY
jgi:hypothetical protein